MNVPVLDVDFARSHFPQLSNGWAFFENAGGSYVPRFVTERLHDYTTRLQVQPGGHWPAAQEAAERLRETHTRLAAMINATPEEIVIGPSTTVNVQVLARALRPSLAPGDEIVVTNQDHEANGGAWRRLADEGITVREWRVDPDSCELAPAALAPLLNERTRLVCFPHVSNIVGSINDVVGITRLAHAAGAMVCVDAVAYAPHRAIDVRAWDVDFYVFSLYKIYGPHLAVLYAKAAHRERLANQNHYFLADAPGLARLNPGGQQHEVSAAAAGVVDYFEALYRHHFGDGERELHAQCTAVFDLIAPHEQALAEPLVDFVRRHPALRLLGRTTAAPSARAPTFSVVAAGWDSATLAKRVCQHRVAVSAHHFYAHRLLHDIGVLQAHGGVLRASMVHYNTLDEVARLIAALDAALGAARA